MRTSTACVAGAMAVVVACAASSARASEGAASYYFAGCFGSFLVALPPAPGLTVASQTLMYGGQAQRSAPSAADQARRNPSSWSEA